MTVASVKNKVVFVCDGINTAFPFDFKVLKADHLNVYIVNGDSEALLNSGTDYVVTNINEDAGGEIILVNPPRSGLKLVIVRELPPVQETAFNNHGPFYPQIHESAFDQVVMLIQQLINTVGSTVGTDSRALFLGLADTDGKGAYRAKGNRITNLGTPINGTDAARVDDIKPFADAAQQAAQGAQNYSQQASFDAEEAKQAAEEARQYAESIDVSSFYTKEETNTAIETAIEENKYDFYRDAPVGFVMDWDGVAPPNEKWLKYDGSTFDPARYPKLAALGRYANNKLPDVSDRYIRYIGNRTDKYLQYHTMDDTIQNITGDFNHAVMHTNYSKATGAFGIASNLQFNGCKGDGAGVMFITQSVNFNAGNVARTSDETRPKTIMIRTRIVKAA